MHSHSWARRRVDPEARRRRQTRRSSEKKRKPGSSATPTLTLRPPLFEPRLSATALRLEAVHRHVPLRRQLVSRERLRAHLLEHALLRTRKHTPTRVQQRTHAGARRSTQHAARRRAHRRHGGDGRVWVNVCGDRACASRFVPQVQALLVGIRFSGSGFHIWGDFISRIR